MKKISLFLALIMFVTSFVGCNDTSTPTTPTASTTPKSDAGNENPNPKPEIEYIDMYYDDRISINVLLGGIAADPEIKDQVVTSKVVGTDTPEENVIIIEEHTARVIAVGTGTAVISANGKDYHIRVNPAPITLAVITGHSQGYGSRGNFTDTALCEAGQVYNTHVLLSSEKWDLDWRKDFTGSTLGYGSKDRVIYIDELTGDAENVLGKGVDGALGLAWTRLTGEKIWVLNCAVGGSSINQWQQDAKENWGRFAVEAINMASTILKNEVAAGHYIYRTTALINFSSANLSYNKVDYDEYWLGVWQDGLWKGLVQGANVDIDGDGRVDRPASLGFVPGWFPSREGIAEDLAIIYYRAASKEFPHVYIASDLLRAFRSDAGVARNFPKDEYVTKNGEKGPICTTKEQVWDYGEKANPSHLLQFGYNAIGFDIAKHMYNHIYGINELEKIDLYDTTGGKEFELVGDTITLKVGEKRQFAIISTPYSVNDLEIIVEGNLSFSNPFYITANAVGTGTLTIKHGDTVIKTVTFKITINEK